MKAFRASPLDNELRQLAFSILRKLSNRIGHLPESYPLSDKFDISGRVVASGGFVDVREGAFQRKNVAEKAPRVLLTDDKAKVCRVRKRTTHSLPDCSYITQRFCEEVAMWKNLSHPNVLTLIAVSETLEEGRFSMVSEWMGNGNIVKYVRNNASNHLQLADAMEGLSYPHKLILYIAT